MSNEKTGNLKYRCLYEFNKKGESRVNTNGVFMELTIT